MFGISNPQSLLRPWRNLTQFTKEFYAMLTSKEPIEREGPVTIRVREGQTALRIERRGDNPIPARSTTLRARPLPSPPKAPDIVAFPGRSYPPRAPITPEEFREERRRETQAKPQTEESAQTPPLLAPPVPVVPLTPIAQPTVTQPAPVPYRAPLLSIAGRVDFEGPEPARFTTPPQVYDPIKQAFYTPKGFEIPDLPDPQIISSGGTTVFVGKVESGTGDTYSVRLYQNGPDGDPDADAVSVKVQMMDAEETIDPDTWLFGIFQFTATNGGTVYFAQPPVWTP